MKVQQCRRACSLGFTLIELLVVISIIALLLAILLPSLKAAHEAGQSSVCASNLKQIYQGAFLHAQDNDDSLPHYAYYGSAGIGSAAGGEFWPAQVAQALDNFEAGLFTCPADNNPKIQVPFYYAGSSVSNKQSSPTQRFTYLPVGYRGHCDLVWDNPLTGELTPRKFSDWKRPEEAIMMLETRPHPLSNTGVCFDLDHLKPLHRILLSGT